MSYVRFGLMILTSTLVMLFLMYLNTYALEHVFFSETRVYMAILMGSVMAVIMLGYMLGMYKDMRLNIAIFIGSAIVFTLSLWLVRSQVTISGTSYMRAMIPHHSIAIMTSERAQIRDSRVRKLADEIIAAQRREIAEMRYLIGEASSGSTVETIYHDPPAAPGSAEDALANTLVSTLDLAPIPAAEASRVLSAEPSCRFNRSPETHPILWVTGDSNTAAAKLNGVLLLLTAHSSKDASDEITHFSAPGIEITVKRLNNEADWRQKADLVFKLEQGFSVGYRGFYSCDTS